jgi:hypothetical protein
VTAIAAPVEESMGAGPNEVMVPLPWIIALFVSTELSLGERATTPPVYGRVEFVSQNNFAVGASPKAQFHG